MTSDESLHFEEQLREEWHEKPAVRQSYGTFEAFKTARYAEELAKPEADRCYKG